jgi:2-oxoisovalerate dehydrogenase E1 component
MLLIRNFEESLLSLFSGGELRGTTHTYLGQEAIAAAALAPILPGDTVFSNHRSHGHFIAYCGEIELLTLEIIGDSGGVCQGLGGSQHLRYRNFFSNGIQGGMVPVAAGTALAARLFGNNGIAVCFLGDGTLGEGTVYETFNLASLWRLPILFVVENNRIAQSTRVESGLAGSIAARPRAFGIRTDEIESNDVTDLLPIFESACSYVRREQMPFCQIVHTHRLGPHSKGDDPRSEEELIALWATDPLVLCRKHISDSVFTDLEAEAKKVVEMAVKGARSRNADGRGERVVNDLGRFNPETDLAGDGPGWFVGSPPPLVAENLRSALAEALEGDETVCILGEDIVDPYGGAFKVTKGLSSRFPERVLATPISEASIVGIGNGLALKGWKPIIEIMFGDFVTLTIDQIVNHMTKFPIMYGSEITCPVILRAPMGGYRGYGPTHSQSLEKILLGIPGLCVVAMSPLHDQRVMLKRMIDLERPVVHVENKMLYGQRVMSFVDGKIGPFNAHSDNGWFPTILLRLTPFGTPADATVITYGGGVPLAMEAARELMVREEWIVDVIVIAQISPLPVKGILEFIEGNGAVVVLEEGTKRSGWGAEVVAFLSEFGHLDGRPHARHAARDTIIPNSFEGELAVLPSVKGLMKTISELVA